MFLQSLSLINFKNYASADLLFSPGTNAFTGNNGSGKTNLLDAIHYLSFCKGYFNLSDAQNIRHQTEFFVIQGAFDFGDHQEQVYCGLKRNQRKVMKMNNVEYERLADHIGRLPVVMIAPVDTMLITEGSEERRRFMDSIISQYDKLYLDDLISYNKALSQRNALLKQFAVNRSFDASMLEIYDQQLIPLGEEIFKKRFEFIRLFVPYFKKHYQYITSGEEEAAIHYESALNESRMAPLLKSALEKDRAIQFTTVGIHKDDLSFIINQYPVKRFASQGQQKSFLVALKLAQFDFIKEMKKMKPLLLLDDIFDKLDDIRVKKLMELVSNDNFGQIFITDTHPERVKHIFEEIKIPLKVFKVANGELQP